MYETFNPIQNQTNTNYQQQAVYPQNIGAGYYPTYQYQKPVQNNEQQNSFQWVQGKAGAEAYLLGRNQKVLLMDSDAPVLYFKATDESGKYLPMKTYDLVEITESGCTQSVPGTESFVHRDEIQKLVNEAIEKYLKEA